jgi:hypothetical protein
MRQERQSRLMVATQQVRKKCGMMPNKEWFASFDLQKAVVASIPRLLNIKA